MSQSATVIGGGIVLGIGSLLLNAVLPSEKPIQVHSLRYEAGEIYQDRTVTTDEDRFYANFTAQIIHAETREDVPWCTGGGSWPYEPGRSTKNIPLAEWVGNDACTPESLPPGVYIPVAAWYWGDDYTGREGEPFTIGATNED